MFKLCGRDAVVFAWAMVHALAVAGWPALAHGVEVPAFTDQTSAAGLTFTHQTTTFPQEPHMMTAGAAVGDFNRDGALDLFVQGGKGQNSKLFINTGGGIFTDQAAQWGIDLTDVEGSSASVGDIDGNGYLDIYVGAIDGRNYVYMNTGNDSFVETGLASGAVLVEGVDFDTYGGAFGDVELDGDLDLATATWNPLQGADGNRLFLNDGSGAFTDVTQSAGVYSAPGSIYGFSPALVDLDGDRYPELPVAADFLTSQYHANLGNGTFTRVTGNGTCTDENGMGSVLFDFDNDADLDWFVTSIYDDDGVSEGNWGITGNRLYRNEGNHQFTDATDLAGVRNGYWGWGTSAVDFNHDGLLDLTMTNGFILPPTGSNPDPDFETDPSRLWINTGDFSVGPTFMEVSTQAGLVHTASGKGLVTFDADNDGDLDVVITSNQDDLKFFRNEYDPGPQRWIQLDLVSPPGNAPDGIGATVELTVGGRTYHRAVFGSPSFMSQDPLRVHFGFPQAKTVDSIVVNWPDGRVSALTDVPSGNILTLRLGDLNGDGTIGVLDLLSLLGSWGPCSECNAPAACPADFDRDCQVGIGDLLYLLGSWD